MERSNSSIPMVIWLFSNLPLEDAPEEVRHSIASWRELNPDHEVRLLTLEDLDDLLDESITNISDTGWLANPELLGLYLLQRYGGIWADVSTLCLRPLSDWLYQEADKTDFFAFRSGRNPHGDLIPWFLAARPNHPLVTGLYKRAVDFHTQSLGKRVPIRHLFKEVILEQPEPWEPVIHLSNAHVQQLDPDVMLRWADVAKIPNKDAHPKLYKSLIDHLFVEGMLRADISDRRNAYLSEYGWQQVRKGLQISERYRLFYVHIPKCGGSSIENSSLFSGHRRAGHTTLTRFCSILGPRIHQFKCLVAVRNPWDRLASAFYYMAAGGTHIGDRAIADEYLAEFEGDFASFLDVFLEQPARYLKLTHFAPAVSFFNPDTCPVPYFVQRLEDINDLTAMRTFTGNANLMLGHDRKGLGHDAPRVLNSDRYEKIAEIYASDITAFGYNDFHLEETRY